MANIIDSLKKLSVENGTAKQNNNMSVKKKNELVLSVEETVFRKSYVLAVCGTQSEPEFRIGTASSNHLCVIYTAGETLSRTTTLTHNKATIVGIKFSPTSKNIIYTATNKGIITACDLRAKGKAVAEFKDSSEDGKLKPLASFDISCDERLIAGGTEHIGGDTFILFWDIRHSNSKVECKDNNLLGGYWQSHMDDVTRLSFHPNKRDILASGSVDGLINIFDLTQPTEDMALRYSLNTESSVDGLGWMNNDNLWCTTFTSSLQFWNAEGVTPYTRFKRSSLALAHGDDPDNCYIVKFHPSNALGQPFLLAGSDNVKGENLRCLSVVNNQLEICYNLIGNKQYVRDSWLHEKSNSLVTVGEDGLINIWRQSESSGVQQSAGQKLLTKIGSGKSRERQHRAKPY
ncbi:WD repeat-containing protein 89-like [Vespa mandarinia]|uniref:WD repeat-containing protein 89-like n=1 Tax=Vespa mandarinia TaxID=7446 RepID=UPI001614DA9B|nr:WD repeat-containing protein 89-like [Vespa mandarinia]